MSLRIYLDDCAFARTLARLLRTEGHDVQVPAEAAIAGMADPIHFQHATRENRVLLTKNPHDFELLHQAQPQHPGLLVIYQDNDRNRDMSYAEIVKAINNLENAGVEIRNNLHVLNAWRY